MNDTNMDLRVDGLDRWSHSSQCGSEQIITWASWFRYSNEDRRVFFFLL